MTLRELVDNIQVQGEILVREYNEKSETYITYCEVENGLFLAPLPNHVWEMEVKYMFCENGVLVIEVGGNEEEEGDENPMTLYELMEVNKRDYDVRDNIFDSSITVCWIDKDDISDNCDKFCMELIKKVYVVNNKTDLSKDFVVADWYGLIKRNLNKFKEFAKTNWTRDYKNEDDFIYQWIKEIHYYFAGYVGDSTYEKLVELVNELN